MAPFIAPAALTVAELVSRGVVTVPLSFSVPPLTVIDAVPFSVPPVLVIVPAVSVILFAVRNDPPEPMDGSAEVGRDVGERVADDRERAGCGVREGR